MPILKRPGVYYNEDVNYELVGEGSKIPVFIGVSGNTATTGYKVDGTQINKYSNWDEVNKTPAEGGVGVYTPTTTNELLKTLYEFFDEGAIQKVEDIGVPFIYVIDVGQGKASQSWLNASTLSKTKRDATVEAAVGIEAVEDVTPIALLKAMQASIITETHSLNLRNLFARLPTNTVSELVAYTNDTNNLRLKRLGLCEKHLFGKTIARICCTPYYKEPGFYTYRSVEPGEFIERTAEEELTLQNAGIIFNHDEQPGSEAYPKMNICLCSTFALSQRPADSLFHARFNADHLLREVFLALYPQIKDNESVSNFNYLQTQIDDVIAREVREGYMIKHNVKTGEGTYLTLRESDYNPYDLIISGQIQSVNSTIAIDVQATLNIATLKVVEE
jgi:hypothetical protein